MKFKTIIIIVSVLLLGAAGFLGYVAVDRQLLTPLQEANETLALYDETFGSPDNFLYAYTAAGDLSYGTPIEDGDIIELLVPSAYGDNLITDRGALEGKMCRINISAGTYITADMLADAIPDADERSYDVLTDFNPIGLEPGDYVDIRINFPMGEDYIAISHKRVEGVYGGVLKLRMNEHDIAVYNSLVADLALFPGTMLYTTKYPEPDIQTPAESFYPMGVNVLRSAMEDPNIAELLDIESILQERAVLETALGEVRDNNIILALLQTARQNIPNRINAGQSEYRTQKELEEQRRLEEELYGQ